MENTVPTPFDGMVYGFDTETTGTDVTQSRIVTANITRYNKGVVDGVKNWLINPGVDIPKEASDVHGITTEEARENGVHPAHALENIATFLYFAFKQGFPVIAFNLAFDWSILYYELRRYDLLTIDERLGKQPIHLIDPYVLDKAMHRYRKGPRKLGTMAEYYGVKLENWHTADADALAAILVTEKLFEKYKSLQHMNPDVLYRAQQLWRLQQSKGLEEYFLKQNGSSSVISGEWPLISKVETQMIWVVTIRTEGVRHAEGHIAADGFTRVFCGIKIPESILDMWADPRNPYKGKGNVTCSNCLNEYNSGRREGYNAALQSTLEKASDMGNGEKTPEDNGRTMG